MSVDTISVTDGPDDSEATADRGGERWVVDVSDVSANGVVEYARSAVQGRDVHLERKGGRTFLVSA